MAIKNGFIEIVKLLLEHGTDVSAKNRWGETALDIAKSSRLDKSEKMQECVALLEDCLAKASQFQPQKIAYNGCSMDSKYVNYRNA
ncbi:MAG: ankyrin repeat domain-containing protein [Alphaproteobacteria bacterium]|nr:ankyrin repeat domain-containing protein [Alphaproteobacteria bacterium]